MRLNQTPPKGAGRAQGVTKTERLIKHIVGLGHDKYGNPIAIRTKALAEATGIPASSIQGMLATAVKHGEIVICKVTPASGRIENEYRAGPGVPPPEFKPLNTQRNGIARGAATRPLPVTTPAPALSIARGPIDTPQFLPPKPGVGQNPGSAASVALTGPTSPEGRAVAEKAPKSKPERRGTGPAPAKASACDVSVTIDCSGTLTISTAEGVIELDPNQTLRLGDFLHGTEGVWRA